MNEAEEIFSTGGERFKNITYRSEQVYKKESKKDKPKKGEKITVQGKVLTIIINYYDNGILHSRTDKIASATTDGQPQAAQHMDAVPCSTPVSHIPKSKKRLRTFPTLLSESAELIEENAIELDELVPIRLDMEIEGNLSEFTFLWVNMHFRT